MPQGKIVHDRPPMLAIGVMIWLGSELMFFSGLFAAFFTIRANTVGPWPPAGTQLDALRAGIFTLVLVSSSFTMQCAVYQAEWRKRRVGPHLDRVHDPPRDARSSGTRPTSGCSARPAGTRTRTGRSSTSCRASTASTSSSAWSPWSSSWAACAATSGGDPGELSAIQGVSYYWHFVDIVWVGLYSCLFLLK